MLAVAVIAAGVVTEVALVATFVLVAAVGCVGNCDSDGHYSAFSLHGLNHMPKDIA